MGEVYSAHDSRLKRDVAIKFLPSRFAQDAQRLSRFEQEARAVAALNHANILVVHDLGTHEGMPYVVCELVDGKTLREALSEGTLSQRRIIEIGKQITQGLSAAHTRGIIHRDLKPENIMLTRQGGVKILDFGLAKLMQTGPADGSVATIASPLSEAGQVFGTVGYMAPEQVCGEKVDHRADLFALGVILYEAAAGAAPFSRASAVETMSAILKDDPPELVGTDRKISPGLERIIFHCLEKNPEKRFQAASDVEFALDSLSETSVVAAQVPRSRRSWQLAAVVSGMVVFSAVAFLAGRRIIDDPPPDVHRLTYQRGTINNARISRDGKYVVYSARWNGEKSRLYSLQEPFLDSRPFELPEACVLSLSNSGQMALLIHPQMRPHEHCKGTLAQVAFSGGAPREIAEDVTEADWSPDGKELAIVHSGGGRDRIEYPIGNVLYETGGYISDLRVSPNGEMVGFLDHPQSPDDRGSVAVLDRKGQRRVLADGWMTEEGLAWAPDGRSLWFGATPSGSRRTLYRVWLNGKLQVAARYPGSLRVQDCSQQGRLLFTIDNQFNGIRLQVPSGPDRFLGWLDWSMPQDLSPDGQNLLFDEEGDGGGPRYSTFIRKTDGSPAVRLGEGTAQQLSPDGNWALVLVPGAPERIVLYPVGAGMKREIRSDPVEAIGSASFTPDGKQLVLSGSAHGQGERLWVLPVDGGTAKPIGPEGVLMPMGNNAAISPDGKSVLATSDHGLCLVPISGGEIRSIPQTDARARLLRWDQDGKSFLSYQRGNLPQQIFRTDAATGAQVLWKTVDLPDHTGLNGVGMLRITPDGRYLAFMDSRTYSDLFYIDQN
jgi:serine/threonine protein kinase/dipeptidyl aminopeptidase/acylaminoacyl peptidase